MDGERDDCKRRIRKSERVFATPPSARAARVKASQSAARAVADDAAKTMDAGMKEASAEANKPAPGNDNVFPGQRLKKSSRARPPRRARAAAHCISLWRSEGRFALSTGEHVRGS
jgi:hypothetical protein